MPLVSTPHLQVDHFANGSDRLAVTFAPLTPARMAPTLDGPGFGGQFLTRSGFDVIAFKTTRNWWYQDVTDEQLAVVAEVAGRYASRVGYGSSMGGYAAIHFAGHLGLQRVLAIAPQFDIRAPWEARWKQYAAEAPWHRTLTPADCDYFIAYDPDEVTDARHASEYDGVLGERLTHIPVAGGGHNVPLYLQNAGLLKGLVTGVLGRGEVPALTRQAARSA